MAKKDVRFLWIQFFYCQQNLMQILHNGNSSSIVKKSQIILGTKTFSMASMIMDDCHKASCSKILHKIKVPLLVFRHSVGKLHHTTNCSIWFHHHHMQLQAIKLRFYRKVLSFH